MKRLFRIELSERALKFLKTKRTDKVTAKPTVEQQKEEADKLWNNKKNKAFEEIRSKLKKMAWGRERCMYCEDNQGTHIDHFYPKSQYPCRAFEWENFLLACESCNSNYKRNQFPLDPNGTPLLIDPTREEPREHLLLSPTTGILKAKSPKGKASIEVFGLYRATLEEGRGNDWILLELSLRDYAENRDNGNEDRAEKIRKAVLGNIFACVFDAMMSISLILEAE